MTEDNESAEMNSDTKRCEFCSRPLADHPIKEGFTDPGEGGLLCAGTDASPIDSDGTDDQNDVWPYCPNCGSELERPAKPYREWTDCPECGSVSIEFYRESVKP